MKSKINKFFADNCTFISFRTCGFWLTRRSFKMGILQIATVGDIEISTKEFGQGL